MMVINEKFTNKFSAVRVSACALAALAIGLSPLSAQDQQPDALTPAERATYADLTSLAERSDLVARVEIRRQAQVKPERAPGLQPGFARLYIEARTIALIAGNTSIGEALTYLVDVPLNEKGKPPKLKKREMLIFADGVPGRPGSVQLTGKHAQLDYSPALEARLRPILTALVAPEKPPKVSGISDALAVPGTLAGESETQIFLETADRSPVSLTVLRRPGQQPVWGVSWGEIIDSAARAPEPQTLRWYRLACSLPAELPSGANLAREVDARRLAARDYEFIIDQLGECEREITDAALG